MPTRNADKTGVKRRLQEEERQRRLERAAAAIDDVLLRAALDNHPQAEPFIRRRWERVRGVDRVDTE